MTTTFSFTPPSNQAFQFQPTLDGQVYLVIVTWSLFGQRYYVNVYDLSGNLIVSLPLIGSPPPVTVQQASWADGTASLLLSQIHGYAVGTTLMATVAGMAPDGFNGQQEMLATGPSTLSYSLATDPGSPTSLGTVSTDVNLLAGYFTSTMVFRQDAQLFEINP